MRVSRFRPSCTWPLSLLIWAWSLGLALHAAPADAAQRQIQAPRESSVTTADGIEIPYTAYAGAGAGDRLFIWLPSEVGPQDSERQTAQHLAAAGVTVWLVDPFSGRFLPVAQSSMDKVPGGDVAALIGAARSQAKRVYLVATARGAIPVLRGARAWQQTHPELAPLVGVILLGPKFFVETPDPGQAAKLMPVVEATNLPVFVIQAVKSPWRWKLDRTVPGLERGGAEVFVRLLPGVRGRFNFRPDATPAEQALGRRLPQLVAGAAELLDTIPARRRPATALPEAPPAIPAGRKPHDLKPFAGDPTPPPLSLASLDGKHRSLHEYRGRVVLVNFWASWCPPCVHEMPSMQRLEEHMRGKPFTILAVNMAETPETVSAFLHTKVKVDFPMMLDRQGKALQAWGVFAFPTTYVVDREGKIRYAVFGAFEWDDPAVVKTLEALMQEH